MASSTIGSAIQDYLFVCRTEAKSPQTVRWYQQKLEYFASFLNRKTSNAVCAASIGTISGLSYDISR